MTTLNPRQKLSVLADHDLRERIEAERMRLSEQTGLRPSRTEIIEKILRDNLPHVERSA